MGSLTGCLRKAGAAITSEDKAAILAKARELRAGGMSAAEAGERAVLEQLSSLTGKPAESYGVMQSTKRSASTVFSPAKLKELLEHDDWAVLTAHDPNATKASPEDNELAQRLLKEDLDAMGVSYLDAIGKYGDIQDAIVIVGITKEQARELGRKYGQESVLTRDGLVYSDGRPDTVATGVTTFDTPPEDYYTEVPSTGAKFSLDLDFKESTKRQYEVPEFREDIPNDNWLQGKIDYAKKAPRNDFGVPKMGSVTGYFSGPVTVPVAWAKAVPGERGEQGKVRQDDLEAIRKIIRDTGSLPLANGKEYVPYIEIGYDGKPWVSEGNHRIMAAAAEGWTHIPVEVRYFDGGQREAGRWAPANLLGVSTKASTKRQTDTPEFKRWFGDSKVVDAQGKPLVVYHGTSKDVDFKKFKISARGSWFTTDPDSASSYAEDNDSQGLKYNPDTRRYDEVNTASRVMPVYLSIKNPYIVTEKMLRADPEEDYAKQQRQQIAQAKMRGHDGMIHPGGVYIAFESTQVKSAIGNSGAFDPKNPDITKSAKRPFYSALAKGVGEMKTNAAPAPAWKDAIKGLVAKGTAKADEVEWSGVNEWLDLQQGKVTRDQVNEYLAANGVQVEETVLGREGKPNNDEWEPDDGLVGNTRYGQYVLPGGTNYRELLLRLPVKADKVSGRRAELVALPGPEMTPALRREYEALLKEADAKKPAPFKSRHWDQDNVLAHLRLNDRTDAMGARVLFVEEIQSDWGQEGKKQGFAQPAESREQIIEKMQQLQNQLRDMAQERAKASGISETAAHKSLYADNEEYRRKDDLYQRAQQVLRENQFGVNGIPRAPFVSKREFAVFKDGAEVTRTDADGTPKKQRYASMEEAQKAADKVGGEARDMGYGAATEKWLALALKRIVKLAVDEGYDKVAFVNGQQSADRYKLSSRVKFIKWNTRNDPNVRQVEIETIEGKTLEVKARDGVIVSTNPDRNGTRLSELLNEELAEKIMAEESGDLSGTGVDIGGKGMKVFYDKIVPPAIKDVLKKVGGGQLDTVPIIHNTGMKWTELPQEDQLDAANELDPEALADLRRNGMTGKDVLLEQPGFDITPAMRERAAGGLPLFSRKRQIDTPEFKRWFGDSKVVDAEGKPLVVYHGTGKDFTEFKPDYYGNIYLTPDPKYANQYALGEQPNVMPVYASAKNVLDLTPLDPTGIGDRLVPRDEFVAFMKSAGVDLGDNFRRSDTRDTTWSYIRNKALVEAVKAAGYDGIKQRESGNIAYSVFSPTQIKSAIGNNGNFDPKNPDITKSPRRHAFGQITPAQETMLRNVGALTTPATTQQRWSKFSTGLGMRVRQGLVDQFAPLKDLDLMAYIQARMSKGSDGTLEATLLYGKPFLNGEVPDVNINDGGFAKVLAKLEGEHDRFLWWVASQRAEGLKGLGLENLFSLADINAGKTLDQGSMESGAPRKPAYDQALKELNAFNDAVLKLAEDSGLIDPATRQLFKDMPYVPFYRVMEDEQTMSSGPRFSSGLVNQRAWKKLKGGSQKLNDDLLANMLQNWGHLYAASARNRAASRALRAAEAMGDAFESPVSGKGTVRVMEQGKTKHFLIDNPEVFNAVSALEYVAPTFFKPFATFKRWLTIGVTASPAFKIRNLLRDSLSAVAQAPLSANVIENVAEGWRNSNQKTSQTYASMLASGGVIRFGTMLEGDRATRAHDLIARVGGKILDETTTAKLIRQVHDVLHAYNELGDRSENVNRVALYKQLIAQNYSHAEASFMARDLLDFSLSGRWPVIRFLAQTVPFFNARLQGLYKLGRAAAEDPKRFSAVVGAVVAASLALLLAYEDDEDWKGREDWDRDNYWWFKIGDVAYRIPKPFEVGAMGTLAERTWEMAFSKDMTAKRFGDRIQAMLFQTFAFNPMPQIAKPIWDVYANTDSFSGRPIETEGLRNMRPEDRATASTTAVARLLGSIGLPDPGQLVNARYAPLSPVQIDFLIRGYFGWLGATSVAFVDAGMRPLTGRGERPDYTLKDLTLGFTETQPGLNSRYVTAFYDQKEAIDEAWASYRAALKAGDGELAREVMTEERDRIAARGLASKAGERLSDINARMKLIDSSTTMTGEQKRTTLDQLIRERNAIAKGAVAGLPR